MREPAPQLWYEPAPPAVVAPRDRRLVHLGLLLLTALTTTIAGARWEGVGLFGDLRRLADGLPFSLTLLAILATHESGHYLMCRRHRVNASLPYFLPAPPMIFPLGTFGAFIRIRARFPDRRALFDVGAAGPWAGFVVAVVALIVGLRLSTVHSGLDVGGVELGDSLLTSWLTRLVLDVDPSTIVLHPIAFAGWIGLLVTCLNLLPAGQLDGGHVLYAVFRRRTRLAPVALVVFLVWLGWTGWPGWYVWALLLTVMLMLGHPPTIDDWQPLGTARIVGSALSLILFVLTFVPEPFKIVLR